MMKKDHWDTDQEVKAEINGDILTKDDKIIANPNCSTIQMLMALYPIQKKYGITRIVVSTYHNDSSNSVFFLNRI